MALEIKLLVHGTAHFLIEPAERRIDDERS